MSTVSRVGASRGALRLVAALLLTALSIVWPGAARADEPPGPAPGGGVVWADAWTNDDGVVDDAVDDAGDVGDVSSVFDANGTDSSDDPSEPGLNPAREEKDVAICTVEIVGGPPPYVEGSVGGAYPGYVCTMVVTLSNDTGVPAEIAGVVVVSDPGLTVAQIGSLPATLDPGEQVQGVFFVQIEQDAAQNDTLAFTITVAATGEDVVEECVPLSEADIPSGAILVDEKGLCVYFFDAGAKACGPDWTEEVPFSWYFKVKKTGGDSTGTLTAIFETAGTLTTSDAQAVTDKSLEYFLYTPTADTIVGAYLEGIAGAELHLEGTCNDPDGDGHVPLADLALAVASVPNGDGTADVVFTLTNQGRATASDIVVSEWMSRGLTWVRTSAERDGTVWRVPMLAPGEIATQALTVSSGEGGSYFISGEVVSAGGGDVDSIAGNGVFGEDDTAGTLIRLAGGDGDGPVVVAFILTALVAGGVLAMIRRRKPAAR